MGVQRSCNVTLPLLCSLCVRSDSLQESVPTAEGESEGDGLRRRNVSLLGSLDRRGKDGEVEVEEEEEEEEGEEYRPPPAREEETGLSLNKCILGAVLLLGLGTIFFSGEFRDEKCVLVWSGVLPVVVVTAFPPSAVQPLMSCCLFCEKCLSLVMCQMCCFSLESSIAND